MVGLPCSGRKGVYVHMGKYIFKESGEIKRKKKGTAGWNCGRGSGWREGCFRKRGDLLKRYKKRPPQEVK